MRTLRATPAKTFIQKARGLLFYKEAFPLFMRTRGGIHTIFMRFPIDIAVLDDNYVVVALRAQLVPYRLYFWNPKYENILELPGGTIQKEKIKIGDKVKLQLL